MISKRIIAGTATAGLLLTLWVGCQSPQQISRSNPGELPDQVDATKNNPRLNATTFFAHGHLLERQGQFERALGQYRAALKIQPDFMTARNRLGITLNKLGMHAQATQEFQSAIAKRPGSAFLYNNLGFSLYLEGRLAEAQQALQRAIELRPTFDRARMNRGVVLAKLGRFEEAFAEFSLVCSAADAYYNLAMIQADAGRYPDAQRSLEAALVRNPQLEPAREKLAEVAERTALIRGSTPNDIAPRIVQAPTLTPVMETTIAADVEPAQPALITPAPSTPPAVTIAPSPTPTQTPIATPAPQRNHGVQISDVRATPQNSIAVAAPTPAREVAAKPATPVVAAQPAKALVKSAIVPAADQTVATQRPITPAAKPITPAAQTSTPPAKTEPTAKPTQVADLSAQVRNVNAGAPTTPAPAAPIAETAKPTTPATALPAKSEPAKPAQAPAAGIQIRDITPAGGARPAAKPATETTSETTESDADESDDAARVHAADRLIDAILHGSISVDAILCELESQVG